jgi:hypothetical protein
MGPAVVAFIVALAARGIFVADRYAIPIDIALVFTAAIGAADIVVRGAAWVSFPRSEPWRTRATLIIVALAAVLITGPPGIFDAGTQVSTRNQRALNANLRAGEPVIRSALASLPEVDASHGVADWPDGKPPLVVVPVPTRPRAIVDLGLPIDAVGSYGAAGIDLTKLPPDASQVILHSRSRGLPRNSASRFEIEKPTSIDGRQVDPLVADPTRGYWVLLVKAVNR